MYVKCHEAARHREGSIRARPEHVCREAEEGEEPRGWCKLPDISALLKRQKEILMSGKAVSVLGWVTWP